MKSLKLKEKNRSNKLQKQEMSKIRGGNDGTQKDTDFD